MAYDIHRIGIVGAGLMGTGIAEVCALAGFDTVLLRATPGEPEPAAARIRASMDGRVKRGKLEAEVVERAHAHLRVTCDRDAIADSDLVIESVVEDLATKRALF
ncbi:MAG TPA: 3-hydroxyacyl-CoA dehydrogenase NAD-binding domain-containing protein, partial [Kofleriaceae bacterium]|nr:3-hydroxyacyl-CoA dehydrogenase NAD-binding domain-containing protein [Kofleriaceae bacterium]